MDEVSTRELPAIRVSRQAGTDVPAVPVDMTDDHGSTATGTTGTIATTDQAAPRPSAADAAAADPLELPELAPLWAAVRTALGRTGRHAAPSTVVRGLDAAGRRAAADLLGRPVPAGPLHVDLADLDAALRVRHGDGVRTLVRRPPAPSPAAVASTGPGTPAGRGSGTGDGGNADRRSPWLAAQVWLRDHPELGHQPWSRRWLEGLHADVTLARVDAARLLQALEVLSAVLDDGAGSWRVRGELAAFAAGDPRALDEGGPVTELVLRGLACADGLPMPSTAPARRALWLRHGVLPDLVSTSCLAVGVAPEGDLGGRRWRMAAIEGAPVHVHARDLRTHAEPWVTVDEAWPYVLVCDQPRVLETLATQFGGRVPAVCTLGSPEPLVVELLHRLRTSGVDVRFHGDLDWDGVVAANHLLDRCRAEPWRMGADDYRAALVPDLPALSGRPVAARWDGELQRVMLGGGRALPAERTMDGLVAAIRAELA